MKMSFAAPHESGVGTSRRSVPAHENRSLSGGGADMDDRAAMDDGDVNDPERSLAGPEIPHCGEALP